MKNRPKTIFRILLFIFIGILVVIAGIQLSFTFYFNNKIKKDLQEAVQTETNGDYKLEIDQLKTNIFNQSVFVSGFLLKPTKNTDPSDAKYFASASEINLVDCSLFSFLFRKHLTISKIELINPSGYLYRSDTKQKSGDTKEKKKFSLYKLISKQVRELNINEIKVTNAHISIYDNFNDSIPSLTSKDNELEISNLKINKSVEESGRLFRADKINLLINRFSFTTPDSLYTMEVKQLRASYTDSTVTLDSLVIVPNYSKKEFSVRAGKQTDRLDAQVAALDFIKMDVKLFFERNWFIAKQLNVNGLKLTAFRDKNFARIPERIPSLQQMLKDIPIYTAIELIKLNSALVYYEEISEGGTDIGKISFNQLNANITGFTSDSTLFDSYKSLEVRASSKFMNAGELTAHYSFPLKTTETVFSCTGRLSGLPLSELNSIIVPSANILIKEGQVDSLIFAFDANEISSKGKMWFYYKGLKIEFLKKKDHKAGMFQEVLSFIAHAVLIKEDNPEGNNSVRATEINYERNPERFVFNYSWKSLLSGIKPAIGIPGGTK